MILTTRLEKGATPVIMAREDHYLVTILPVMGARVHSFPNPDASQLNRTWINAGGVSHGGWAFPILV